MSIAYTRREYATRRQNMGVYEFNHPFYSSSNTRKKKKRDREKNLEFSRERVS